MKRWTLQHTRSFWLSSDSYWRRYGHQSHRRLWMPSSKSPCSDWSSGRTSPTSWQHLVCSWSNLNKLEPILSKLASFLIRTRRCGVSFRRLTCRHCRWKRKWVRPCRLNCTAADKVLPAPSSSCTVRRETDEFLACKFIQEMFNHEMFIRLFWLGDIKKECDSHSFLLLGTRRVSHVYVIPLLYDQKFKK